MSITHPDKYITFFRTKEGDFMYYVIVENEFGKFLAKCSAIISEDFEAAFVFDGQPDTEHRGRVAATMYILKEDDPAAIFAREAFGGKNPARVTAIFYRRDVVEETEASEE